MFRTLKNIFNSDPSKVLDSLKDGADKLILTKEEKADYNQKASETYLEWIASTSGSRLARRSIGYSIVWYFLGIITLYCGFVAFGFETQAEAIMFAIKELQNPFLLVVSFYFGGPVIGNLLNKGKK